MSNAALIRSTSYCGTRTEHRDASADQVQKPDGAGARSSIETGVNIDQMGLQELQAHANKFLTSLFQYWCKKKSSRYLRISKFFMQMVVYGLAPNTQYLQRVI